MGRSNKESELSGIVAIVGFCGIAAIGMTIVTGELMHWAFIGAGVYVGLLAVQTIRKH